MFASEVLDFVGNEDSRVLERLRPEIDFHAVLE